MNDIIKYLQQIIPLRKSKNNKTYISNTCPFSGEVSSGGRVFRYSLKLKVGKCYCCGKSFKELYWLKLNIENHFKVRLIQINHDPLLNTEQKREYERKRLIEDNSRMPYSNSEKSEDDDLPF